MVLFQKVLEYVECGMHLKWELSIYTVMENCLH